jgi:2-polyprenyl-6-methoxyphenol hydroxylase-like FAD-dependent oxidoreductase
MTTTTTDVLVIGAGPTGLMTANILTRSGVHIRILDKKASPTQESRAVVVQAKTLELLDKFDLADEIIEHGEPLLSAQILSQSKRMGTLTFRNGDGDKCTPYPFILVYGQDQMEHLLLRQLTEVGNRVEWNTELIGLQQTADGVQAHIRTVEGNEEIINARWIIGADGSHSSVRHALSLGFVGQSYTQTLFVADVDMDWKLGKQQAGIDLTRQGFFLFVPMHGPGRFRLFGTLPPELAGSETITSRDVQQILDAQSYLRVVIRKAHWTSVYHPHQRITKQFRVGRVFLAGDAAHVHSPAGGQGMNTGLGDAYNLAWKLALVVKGYAHETLLDSYEAERLPLARSVLNGSDLGFQLQATTNPVLRWLKLFVLPPLFRLVSPLPRFQQRAFWGLSQLWTSYRNSPAIAASESGKHGLRVGDRAPYGFFEVGPDTGKSIFSLFKGPDHHLLLFVGSKLPSAFADLDDLETHLRTLIDSYALPLHLHVLPAENQHLGTLYGVHTSSLFLVRPDGQIAYHGLAEDLDRFKVYLDTLFPQRESRMQTTLGGMISLADEDRDR